MSTSTIRYGRRRDNWVGSYRDQISSRHRGAWELPQPYVGRLLIALPGFSIDRTLRQDTHEMRRFWALKFDGARQHAAPKELLRQVAFIVPMYCWGRYERHPHRPFRGRDRVPEGRVRTVNVRCYSLWMGLHDIKAERTCHQLDQEEARLSSQGKTDRQASGAKPRHARSASSTYKETCKTMKPCTTISAPLASIVGAWRRATGELND
jgi:hypothetical protein